MAKSYWVYIITNYTNNVLYTGFTNNLKHRTWQHKNAIVNSFSKTYKLYKLVWFEEFPTPEEAIIIEKRIKGWIREKKIKLIQEMNPSWKDLNQHV